MKPKGRPKNTLSNLSSTPPCPGKKFPVSLTLLFLLRKEKNKSPIWQIIEVSKPTKIILIFIILVK